MGKSKFKRRFGKKTYRWTDRRATKAAAKRKAESLRKQGHKARVTKGSNGYDVWRS